MVGVGFRFRNVIYHKWSDQVRCVYWNYTDHRWRDDGCQLVDSDRWWTVCQCRHLTNFAALIDLSGRENNQRIKSALTYLCCGLSAVSLLVSILLTYRLGRQKYSLHNDQFRWKNNRYVISLNVALCLLATNLLTVFGLDRTEFQVSGDESGQ